MLRVLVCGGRDYDDMDLIREIMPLLPKGTIVVHGAATGADTKAAFVWVVELNGVAEPYPARWDQHGKAAGPIRNQQMLDTGLDLVVAFPGGRGTADMKNRAYKAGVPVVSADHPEAKRLIQRITDPEYSR